MLTKAIRGAITLEDNTKEAIENSTVELLGEMIKRNNIEIEMISHVIFTMTKDLDAAFPAEFARKNMGFDDVAMMCFNELDVPKSLKMCLRIMIVINCGDNFTPEFVYLKDAQNLRR